MSDYICEGCALHWTEDDRDDHLYVKVCPRCGTHVPDVEPEPEADAE